jgi:8-oxo-dGTP pyrophosphatase MutT (NUDIX family)
VNAPSWLEPLLTALPHVQAEQLSRFLPPEEGGRHSAVLILFGEGPRGPDLLFIERAATLRSHAGQPAFPGGALDEDDGGPIDAALREAEEEVGLDRSGVEILGTLPDLWLPPSQFVVTPVLAWWRLPSDVGVVDRAEVAAVARVPIADLADPANRLQITHPNGWVGPAFEVDDMLIWGFTAGVTDRLLALGGWELPWDRNRRRELDPETLALAMRTVSRPTP